MYATKRGVDLGINMLMQCRDGIMNSIAEKF